VATQVQAGQTVAAAPAPATGGAGLPPTGADVTTAGVGLLTMAMALLGLRRRAAR
jgi:hypothetical protein